MNRRILMSVLFAAATAALGAQDANQNNPYQGTSNPPPDEQITTSSSPQAKPPAGKPVNAQPTAPSASQRQSAPQPTPVDPSRNLPEAGTDDGIVQVAPETPASGPALNPRGSKYDPDGDIVRPHPLRPGELADGTMIRVHLLERLSTTDSESGQTFRTKVASDVLQDGNVLIPAGAEIDGKVLQVSTGHVGGHGSMRLQPETVILPDGKRYRLYAEVTGTPGSRTHIGGEGTVLPNSRMKRNGIEYGGAVGAGAATGALLGGPVGALTGSLIGAGAITAHLLINHPQASLEPGTVLLFTLTQRLSLTSANTGRSDVGEPAVQLVGETADADGK